MKRLLCIILPLVLAASLSACAIPLFTESYSNPTETPAEQSGSPDGLPPGVYHIPHTITIEEQATGDKYITEYIQSATGNGPIPDGRVYMLESGDGTELELRREDWELDEHYNIINLTITTNCTVTEKFTFELTYGESNQLLRKVCLSGGEEVYTEEYTYDPSGNIVSSSHYIGNMLEYRVEYTYDEGGRLQTVTTYAADGSTTERKEHSFDEKTLKDTVLTYDGSENCVGMQIDYYYPNGTINQSEVCTQEGELISYIHYLHSTYTVY